MSQLKIKWWIYQPTHLPTWNRVLFEKLIAAQLLKKLYIFYGTQRFITISQEPAPGHYLSQMSILWIPYILDVTLENLD
jgi:hypothetical protein